MNPIPGKRLLVLVQRGLVSGLWRLVMGQQRQVLGLAGDSLLQIVWTPGFRVSPAGTRLENRPTVQADQLHMLPAGRGSEVERHRSGDGGGLR